MFGLVKISVERARFWMENLKISAEPLCTMDRRVMLDHVRRIIGKRLRGASAVMRVELGLRRHRQQYAAERVIVR